MAEKKVAGKGSRNVSQKRRSTPKSPTFGGNEVNLQFGGALREVRLAKGCSQSMLAGKAGVDRTYISQIELGAHSPSITVLCRLSKALGVRPSALVLKMQRGLDREGR